ncbi:MAG: response regulator receiver modulated diguanylate cyclase [Proteobacteria bacterium]|nr:response regulator receiver modulated diguanylate cyclase [Pseudomonadota bacterium]
MTKLQKVLVVDASRLVRASLSKLLRGYFDVCEERDADSAWQTLVLDSSVIAVFSGLDISSIEGAGLVERLRASKLPRLNGLPYFLLISDSFTGAARERALEIGVSEFIPKRTAGQEFRNLLLHLINPDLLPLEEQTVMGEVGELSDVGVQSEVGVTDLMLRVDSLPDLSCDASPTDGEDSGQVAESAGEPGRIESPSAEEAKQARGVLVFGLDGYEEFRLRYGWDLTDKIVQKILGLLSSKIHSEEQMLPLVGGRIAIISSVAGREQAEKFARSVCLAMQAADISVRGTRVPVTVSAGIAAMPDDFAATTTDELMHLAISRYDAAVLSGGNRVVCVTGCGGDSIDREEFFARLKVMLADEPTSSMMSCKGWLGIVCKRCRKSRAAGEAPLCPPSAMTENC